MEANSFVYSVPFNAADLVPDSKDILVTASHAVFHTEGGKKAPAAVVGFQFRHEALVTLLRNITSPDLNRLNRSDDIEYFLLDNHGYVVVGPQTSDTGLFFGDIRSNAIQKLVEENIYKVVEIHDYQGVCFAERDTKNAANILRVVSQSIGDYTGSSILDLVYIAAS